jgi:cell division protease FtsH
MLPNADRISKVSIIPRGLGALGYTLQLPTEDRYLLTRSELRDRMAGLMGGRVAEEEIFGEPSTGASNDLQQATHVARLMVRDYGMSAEVGPVTLSDDRGPTFLGVKVPESRSYSDQTALAVDREVQALVVEAQERARELIRRYREKLESAAARLLATEVIEEDELTRLWGPKAERPGGLEGRGRVEAPPEPPGAPAATGDGGRSWPVREVAQGVFDPGKG